MDSRNIFFFFFIIVTFLYFATIEAHDTPSYYIAGYCSPNVTTANSPFELNLRTLLSSLSSNGIGDTQFYNTTVTGKDSSDSDSVYGLFMCWGDITSQDCHHCVVNATQQMSTECFLSKQGVIWYDVCMIWYSNRYFFSTVDLTPYILTTSSSSSTISGFYATLLSNQLSRLAKDTRDSGEKYTTNSLKLNYAQTLYSLGQCMKDLSSNDCTACLGVVIGTKIPWSRLGSVGGRVLYPNWNLRFELFQFYRDTYQDLPPNVLQGTPPPPGPTEKQDSSKTNNVIMKNKGIFCISPNNILPIAALDIIPTSVTALDLNNGLLKSLNNVVEN